MFAGGSGELDLLHLLKHFILNTGVKLELLELKYITNVSVCV